MFARNNQNEDGRNRCNCKFNKEALYGDDRKRGGDDDDSDGGGGGGV